MNKRIRWPYLMTSSLPRNVNGVGGFPFIPIVNKKLKDQPDELSRVINNEYIHCVLQMIECLFIGFYALYGIQMVKGYLEYGNWREAYENNCLEIDSREYDHDPRLRPWFNWRNHW